MTLTQRQVDKIRHLYDTTACSIGRIARNIGCTAPTVVKYLDQRDLMPTEPADESARWSGKNNSAENRGD